MRGFARTKGVRERGKGGRTGSAWREGHALLIPSYRTNANGFGCVGSSGGDDMFYWPWGLAMFYLICNGGNGTDVTRTGQGLEFLFQLRTKLSLSHRRCVPIAIVLG